MFVHVRSVLFGISREIRVRNRSCSIVIVKSVCALCVFSHSWFQISSNVGLESSEKISERSQYLSSFENRFYSVFDEIEQYPYSNLHKEPKLRLGFTMMVPEFLFRALRTKELTELVQSSV